MNLFVADPHWGWWIILYFFLGGIAAGAYFTSSLLALVGSEADRPMAQVGYRLTLPLIALCGIFLIVDLDRPERFWHMLLRSETVHQALDEGWPTTGPSWQVMVQAPHVKWWSPMSVGSWALLLFGLFSTLSVLGGLWPCTVLAHRWRRTPRGRVLVALVRWCIQLPGCAIGFFVAAYTGALLTATNQPVWSDSNWIAALFLTSAASTGIATMILVASLLRIAPPEPIQKLQRADVGALILELAVFCAFLVSLGPYLGLLVRTWSGGLLVGGTLVIGLLLPLVLHLGMGASLRRRVVFAALLALIGGFVMRYAIVTTPPELLARGPEVLAEVSSKDRVPVADQGTRSQVP